ncbi:hypothetical protein ACHAWF_001947, partial [Thalassiosira exigua]
APNKKKNRQRKKGSGGAAAAAAPNGGADGADLDARALESLTRLADALTSLDEAGGDGVGGASAAEGEGATADATAAAPPQGEGTDAAGEKSEGPDGAADDAADAPSSPDAAASSPATATATTAPESAPLARPSLPLSHWRTLPLSASSAYSLLDDGASYLHATSTKYALVGKVDPLEGGKLSEELRKGAELIGTGTLLLFSESCGSSRSLRHYVKQSSRAVVASVIALVKSFQDGSARGEAHDGNNVGAQRTGAVWSACDRMTQQLPKGNRAAMRRELMVWVRDCNESIGEFEEVLALGPRDSVGDEEGEDEDAMIDEEQYTEAEMKVAKACVNVMKCSKNVLGLVLKACECAGERVEALLKEQEAVPQSSKGGSGPAIEEDKDDGAQQQVNKDEDGEVEHNGLPQQEPKNVEGGTEGKTLGTSPSCQQAQSDGKIDCSMPQRRRIDERKESLQWIGNLHDLARVVGEGATDLGITLYPPLDPTSELDEALRQGMDGLNLKSDKENGHHDDAAEDNGSDDNERDAGASSLGSTAVGLRLEWQLRALSECVRLVGDASEHMSEEVREAAARLGKAVGVRRDEGKGAIAGWDRRFAES